ncbi:MAG: type II toxin-antitoxin system VapC family toxin [Clostridiales bacterium]|nr:type II toxin-antitoxin system VapC family toxin [Clostridiales bacterium]
MLWDTSALVKLYVDEEGSDIVRSSVKQTSVVATAKVAYVEARSAFARAKREGLLSNTSYRHIIEHLRYEWRRYLVVEISDGLNETAGGLAEEFSLRGFDALHLASALFLQHQTGQSVLAACWDARLWEAFKHSGLETVPVKHPGL